MIWAYDFEVFKHDWLVVFKNDQSTVIFHNDQNKLKNWIRENKPILVGFNNYHYDDKILFNLLSREICTPADLHSISNRIIGDKLEQFIEMPILTIDTRQELDMNLSLKAIEGYLGWDIVECSVPWDIKRPLTQEELIEVTKYCEHDVDATMKIFELREDYFSGKSNLVKEFDLDTLDIKKTQASLSATVLGAKSNYKPPKDRLYIQYDPNINWKLIPPRIREFFDEVELDYKKGRNPEKMERNRKLFVFIGGISHKLGFGGIHGAIKYYVKEGNFIHIDVGSYYPALMINNNWISRACENPEKFSEIRDTRFALKKAGDSREYIYKIILNSTFGATKAKYNKMFDPRMANNICVNGQIILIQLITELKPYCRLIQSNTDGIIVQIKDIDGINNVLEDFGNRFNLTFSKTRINKIVQRDVNNYAVQYANGKIKSKGIFDFKNWENNSLNVIAKGLHDHFFRGGNVLDTVLSADVLDFQTIAKKGSTYKHVEFNGEKIQNVNRVFATKTGFPIYKVKENGQRDKIANTSEKSTVWNGSNYDGLQIDRDYYYQLIQDEISKFHPT
jgi:DNA polymerase